MRHLAFASMSMCLFAAIAWINLSVLSPSEAVAGDGNRDVPTELFGITVGAVYNIGNPDVGDLGNFPVKKFAGIRRFLGSGVSYYFEPIKANSEFEYIEEKKKPTDRYFTTSFRSYIWPLLPPNITTMDELSSRWNSLQYRVALVEWQKKMPDEEDAYYRSMDYCATFAASFDVKAETSSIYDNISKWYSCTFTSGERQFEVRNVGEHLSISLNLRRDIRDKIEKDTEAFFRRLKAKELLE